MDIDIEELDSMGLHLVTTLVNQLNGELKIKRNIGPKLIIKFNVKIVIDRSYPMSFDS